MLIGIRYANLIMPIIPHIGVVLSFMGSLRYFLIILKELLTILSLSNPVLQSRDKSSDVMLAPQLVAMILL